MMWWTRTPEFASITSINYLILYKGNKSSYENKSGLIRSVEFRALKYSSETQFKVVHSCIYSSQTLEVFVLRIFTVAVIGEREKTQQKECRGQ